MILDVIMPYLVPVALSVGGWSIRKAYVLQSDIDAAKSDVLDMNKKLDYIVTRLDKLNDYLLADRGRPGQR